MRRLTIKRNVTQEARSLARKHGQEPLGLPQAAELRAGIEANISCLKRVFGLARCTWRGWAHFKAYVWSSVVAYNLALVARLAAP
jgi:IS5 family transposase